MDAGKIKKIFFYRVCGTGMGAAACLLKEKGYQVEGGDINFYPPMGDYLKTMKIPCHHLDDVDDKFLKQFDLIVVGNVVAKGSDAVKLIEGCGVEYASFPSVMGELVLKDIEHVVGVAGTHGKTTTAYLFSQVFKNLGCNPGHFVGGVIEGLPSATVGDGKYFFIESDEYDSAYFEKISKFRLYHLKHLILTSLEFDHGDIFNDIEDIKDEFRYVIPKVSSHIFSEDYIAAKELMTEFDNFDYLTFGENSKIGPQIIETDSSGTRFSLNDEIFKTNLVGIHNILNLSTVILFAQKQKIELEKIKDAIQNLKLVKRRQEERGYYQGALVIDDFAHHPRAFKLTIDGIKTKYPDKRLVVIIEPNSATARSSYFQEEYPASLMGADEVIVAKPARPTTIDRFQDLDCKKVSTALDHAGIPASVYENLSGLRSKIDKIADERSVILVLSNGTCLGLWESDFVDEVVQ